MRLRGVGISVVGCGPSLSTQTPINAMSNNVGPDLDPNCLTLIVFLKDIDFEKVIYKKNDKRKKKIKKIKKKK